MKMLKAKSEGILTNIDTLKMHNLRVNAVGYNISPTFTVDRPTNLLLRGNVNGELLKGSFLVNYNYSSMNYQPWNNNLTFNWNKPLLDRKWLKTLNVYHDYSNLVTTTHGYVTAVTISNEKHNSYLNTNYTYQGKTTPDAEVEIYNNGTLVQYVRSDSLGHYQVEVPTYGGDNKVVAVSYDSFGLPVSSEELIYLPPNMQPRGKLGYRLTSGYADDDGFFVAPMFVYGLTSYLTLSAGNETMITPSRSTSIAILGLKLSMLKKIRLDFDYVPTVKWNATLSTNIGRRVNGNFTYERYRVGQTVVDYAPQERLSLNFNGDLPFRKLRGNYYLNALYYKYPFTESFSAYFGVYFWLRKFLINASVSSGSDCMKIENLSYMTRAGYNLSDRWYVELLAEYRSHRHEFLVRDRVNYQFKNQLVAFMESEYSFGFKQYNVSVGVTWRLPYMQVRPGLYNSKYSTSCYAGISGSAIFHQKKVAFSERYVAGSSILVVPYIDKNGNKVYDKDEPVYKGATVILHTAGEEQHSDKGILFTNIPSGVPFKLVIPQQSCPDITWQIEPRQFNMLFSSYQSRSLYIPVRVISEVLGEVYTIDSRGQRRGVEGITVTITNIRSYEVIRVKSDEWGRYNYMGLTCGEYKIDIPQAELAARKLAKKSTDLAPVEIGNSIDGVQIDMLDMELRRVE